MRLPWRTQSYALREARWARAPSIGKPAAPAIRPGQRARRECQAALADREEATIPQFGMPNRGLKRCSGRKRSPQSAHARVDRAAYALPAPKRLPTRNTGTRQTKRAPHAERNYQRASRARGGRQNNSQPPYATRVARWARAPRALEQEPGSQIALGRAHCAQREAIIGFVGACGEHQATSVPA